MFVLVAILVLALFFTHRLWVGYPSARYVVLGRGEAAFLSAAAETLFPPGAGFPLDGRAADLPGYSDRYLQALPRRQQQLIRALFVLFEQATLIFPAQGIGAFRRFSSMGPEQRCAYLEGWESSRTYLRRMALTALKAVLILGYMGREENLESLGLGRFEIEPVICEADLLYPPIGQPRTAIRYGHADLSERSNRSPLRVSELEPL